MIDNPSKSNGMNPNNEENRHDGVKHEHFNLQSSQTQPYDSDRMTGKPAKSNENSEKTDSEKK